jgi:MFS transporter, PPP family, 3-phenylpropionic acid transporter
MFGLRNDLSNMSSAARSARIRISACFALMASGAGMQLPFLPLWLTEKGLANQEIAGVLASMLVARAVAQPVVSWLADRFQNRRLVVRLSTIAALIAVTILSQLEDQSALGFGCLALAFAFSPVFPLVESFSVDASAAHGIDYGRMRLWASISFLSGGLLAGALLTQIAISQAIYLMIVGYALAVVATFLLPQEAKPQSQDAALEIDTSSWRFLFASPFAVVIAGVSVAMSSHALHNSFSTVYWTSLGFNTFMISLFWTSSVLSEVVLFFYAKRVALKFGTERLIMIGIAGGITRWIVMAFVESGAAFVAICALHVLTFAAMHLGTMHFIRENVPLRLRNRAQGLYSAISGGVFMSGATFLSGQLFEAYAGLAFLAMAALSAVGLAVVNLGHRWARLEAEKTFR